MQVLFFIAGLASVGFIFSSVLYILFAKSALPLQPEEEAELLEKINSDDMEEAA